MFEIAYDPAQLKRIEKKWKNRRHLEEKIEQITFQIGMRMFNQVVENSPRDTGQYAANWEWEFHPIENLFILYNYSPQTMRLEFGYVGVDSMGRHYAQAPQPHIIPAKLVAEQDLKTEISRVIKEHVAGR